MTGETRVRENPSEKRDGRASTIIKGAEGIYT